MCVVYIPVMRNNNPRTVFIVGAGFSHALAGLPLGKTLASLIYERAKKTSPKDRHLRKMADCYKRVWEYLQDQAGPLIDKLQSDGTQIETLDDGTHPINLEYMLTLIDLNLNDPYFAKGIKVDLQGCPIPYLKGLNHFVLQDARGFIQHQIYSLFEPSNYQDIDRRLLNKFMELVSKGDAIITFNYDLLLEEGLFTRGLWNPLDGYGIGGLCEDERILNEMPPSEVELIKLHGSLNWSEGGQIVISPEVVIHTSSFGNQCFFPGMATEATHRPYHLKYPHRPIIIMPTYLKFFDKSYEVQLVNRAFDLVRNADKVYIIGYSIPAADVTANLILSQIRNDAEVVVINKNDIDGIKKRLSDSYGIKTDHLIHEQTDIKGWIENDFQYLSYQHWVQEEAFFDSMMRAQRPFSL